MSPHYIFLQPEGDPPAFSTRPYRLILVSESETEEDWRAKICAHLVATRCLYFVSWGEQCETWHDDMDWALLDAHGYEDIPDDDFIMTTWHADDPMKSALNFGAMDAQHPDVELKATYIMHVAESADEERILSAFHEARTAPLDRNGYAPWEPEFDPSTAG